ncbi:MULTISPECIES: PTS fructose transporter subunit IIBC [unclassified Gilliamella]|uniref:PTS fructose transporter subunit IIBC n=1 Tax=unclassified Gilliamella TaxID=2685620 RepID=UPI00226A9F00|nr:MULTISPECIES: PTS fructose transporter subunit IIBC [unclassified Gilliamella]MCX8583878.1 PTS fructose transporter subunit IIBC [Gilliamella sp. B3372]MCX8594545.1 PTS fructose transporter subunit IIBC [Gilliamella sp. B3367]MCX8662039.1 PTS fructose transporter subunit IIBC [Gilliamella sp. B2911]MCX8670653.1 PTS fructose transporter subunit IIBC [Gilliamella sp. B2785]MCX8675484.1 PTS fructose transporter subunit IIBC [Gilliamella sp. B3023]
MNIYIVEGSNSGPVNGRLAKAELALAANSLNFKIVDNATSADTIISVGSGNISDKSVIGKKVYVVNDINDVFADPKKILNDAQSKATVYEQSTGDTSTSVANSGQKRIVAVTACPTGVAHTFMAAEAIEEEAKKRGWWCKVETRGSVGVGNELTPEEIASADVVIAACDIDVDLSKFAGKKLYRTKTGPALKKTAQELDKAFEEATIYQPSGSTSVATSSNEKKGFYQHLLTGVSYMLPMVVAGGLIIALSFAFGQFQEVLKTVTVLENGVQVVKQTLVNELVGEPHLAQIGGLAFSLMVPLLAGYIAYSIADRPGLAPGLVGGLLAVSTGAGFLGGIIIGYFAGYVALAITKYLPLPKSMEALKPILIVPLLATLITGLVMQFVVGTPIAWLMKIITVWLNTMNGANAVMLGALLGGMMCTDMGGPINKVAYAFGTGMISSQVYAPMAAVMAGGMVPPLAMGLATLIARKKFAKAEQESGKASLVLGLCFISEGAIPFAARDPLRVIPCCIVGGAITGGMALAFGSTLMTPHGGLFALAIPGVVKPVGGYILSIVAGSVIAGVAYALIKKPESQTTAIA